MSFVAALGLGALGLAGVATAANPYHVQFTGGIGVRVHTGPHLSDAAVGNPLPR